MRRIDALPVLVITGATASFGDAMAWAITSMAMLGHVFAVLIVTTAILGFAWGYRESW